LAWSPDVGTLMQVWQSAAPADVRPEFVPEFLSISRGTDRSGRMAAADGERLRQTMLETAERAGDRGCLAVVYADAGKQAAKAKDDEAASARAADGAATGGTGPA
jgi:hypothetical protein